MMKKTGANHIGTFILGYGKTLIDVGECTLRMRLNDKEVVFKVNKTLNTPSHYIDLCIIIDMEVDKYGVKKFKPLVISSDSLFEFPKLTIKPKIEKLEENTKKLSIERAKRLESKHSRGQKRIKRWTLSMMKKIRHYG